MAAVVSTGPMETGDEPADVSPECCMSVPMETGNVPTDVSEAYAVEDGDDTAEATSLDEEVMHQLRQAGTPGGLLDLEEEGYPVGDEDKRESDAVAVKVDAIEDGTADAVGTFDAVDAAELADEAMEADTIVADTVVADTFVAGAAEIETDAVAAKVDAVEDGTVDAVDAAELADEAMEANTVVADTVVADTVVADTIVADTIVADAVEVEADTVAFKIDAVEDGTVDAVDAAELADEAMEANTFVADTVVADTVVADAAEVEADAANVDVVEGEAVAVGDGQVDGIKRRVTFALARNRRLNISCPRARLSSQT